MSLGVEFADIQGEIMDGCEQICKDYAIRKLFQTWKGVFLVVVRWICADKTDDCALNVWVTTHFWIIKML